MVISQSIASKHPKKTENYIIFMRGQFLYSNWYQISITSELSQATEGAVGPGEWLPRPRAPSSLSSVAMCADRLFQSIIVRGMNDCA